MSRFRRIVRLVIWLSAAALAVPGAALADTLPQMDIGNRLTITRCSGAP